MSNKARRRSARSRYASRRSSAGVFALVVVTSLSGCARDDACCSTDADCAAGALCFEGLCTQACDDVSQCREGEVCLAGACVAPLRQPSRCPFVDKREPVRPIIDAGAPPDAGHERPDAGPQEPRCAVYEPNDARGEAPLLPEGAVDAAICPDGDDDWYRLVPSLFAAQLHVLVRFEHDDGDLDVEVTDEGGNRLAVSQLTGNVEEIVLPLSEPRDLFVHVYGFGRAQNDYTLEVELQELSGVCVDDELEENDSAQNPTLISPGSTSAGVFCAGDPDVFTTAIPPGARALALLSYQRGDELNLEVREAGAGILGASTTFSGLELVPFARDQSTVVTLRVGGTHTQAGARPYELMVRLGDGSCGLDLAEPNDVVAESVTVALPANDGSRVVQGIVCGDDVDVWRLLWTPGSDGVELELIAGEGTRAFVVRDNDLSLIEPLDAGAGITLLPSISVVSNEVLVFVIGRGDDTGYQLRGRAYYEE